jgi:hypothetical protein
MFFPAGYLPPDVQENMFKRLNEYRRKEEERLEKERKNKLIKENIEKAKKARELKEIQLRKEKENEDEIREAKRKEIFSEMVKNPPKTFSGIMAYGNLLGYYSKKN